jgi:hypothetical protein
MNGLATYTKWENRFLNIIIQSLSSNQLMTMHQETTAWSMWEAFEKGLINRFFLTRRFFTYQMSFKKTMEQHVNKWNEIVE